MKKTLLALATASTVAIAGTSVAAAEDTPTNQSSSIDLSSAKEGEKSPLAGSADTKSSDDLFGWNQPKRDKDGQIITDEKTGEPVIEKTSLLEKITSIGALFGAIVTIVGGIATLIANFQKIADSFKK
ncbi:hypothetical protein [uncultured Corynebacterium sp.]|uniref:hypothetical protein n=1 Tax=uncultured Corynebacterium sp. TaxID=159447 RepID=UPI0025E0619D|nr:hypothetical protein [uncultured Corynebacterium sp.]